MFHGAWFLAPAIPGPRTDSAFSAGTLRNRLVGEDDAAEYTPPTRRSNKKKMAASTPFQPADGQLDTLLCWFRTALPARTKALELTSAARNEPDPFRRVHFVVALQHGNTVRAADGSYARVPILDAAGKKLKGFKYLVFNVAQLARHLELLRIHRPACMNLFEEVNAAQPAAAPPRKTCC